MQFDMNRAWREASAMVGVNAQVLAVIAGVFFFLPAFAMSVFVPAPEPPSGAEGMEALNALALYYSDSLPWLVIVSIAQAIGVLALLALLTDRSRPTVAQALRIGTVSLLPYVGAQLLLGLVIGVALLLVVGLGVSTQSIAVAALLIPLAVVLFLYVTTKMSLVAPVIVIDGIRNPINALQRSWKLTKGNSLRLFLFYFLVLLAFLVISIVASAIVGLLAALVFGGEAERIVHGLVSGLLSAVLVVYFAAIIASAHRQLAGPSPDAVTETFE